MIKNYIKCGITGWCLEIIWTGYGSLKSSDYSLIATTSIWMFFIYGLAIVIKPVYNKIKGVNIIFRGLIYMLGIFLVEFLSGQLLMNLGICPWDYSDKAYNISGVICLYYAPLWFISGLIFEFILRKNDA